MDGSGGTGIGTTRIVVMGVSGCGKTTVAVELAALLGARYVEADDLHSAANVAKMAAGTPLDDDDRWPWLAAVRSALRAEEHVVVTCSALRRTYRDALRAAGDVRFVDLRVSRDEAVRRVAHRHGHYMHADMVDSQFAVLEPPAGDETDVAVVDTEAVARDEVAAAAARLLRGVRPGTAVEPLLEAGAAGAAIGAADLQSIVQRVAEREILAQGARRVLLVPPDHTRLRSFAGHITAGLHARLRAHGIEVGVLPALGMHARMTPEQVRLLLGDGIAFEEVLEHTSTDRLTHVGEISADETAAVSGGLVREALPVDVNEQLLAGWDLVVSIGQVVPHEVIGMSGFTKNLVIGLGGAETIDGSHFLGAACGMESIMGRAHSPVRDVVDAAFDRFLAARVPVLWLLTVVEDTGEEIVLRGLFAGRGGSGDTGGAAYRSAAKLAGACNVNVVEQALPRVVCRVGPEEFHSTWLANKAVYRTRMAIADGGELVVLAPTVRRFGESDEADRLIRRHGYRGREATLAALTADSGLAARPGVAAHLVHGSSEGRFTITYCTDPAAGGLAREAVEAVGYRWRALADELERLDLEDGTATGVRVDRDGQDYLYIANPALGLWTTAAAPAREENGA